MPRYPTRQVAQRQQEIFAEQIRDHYDPELHEDDGAEEADEDPNEEEEEEEEEEKEDPEEIETEPTFKRGALTPARDMRGVLDYTLKSHNMFFKEATAKLEEDLFDLNSDTFFAFMNSVQERARKQGWSAPDGILWVKPRPNAPKINILESYGSITLERIRKHELTYWDKGTRASQDDRMLYECIMASISMEGKMKVQVKKDEYLLYSSIEEDHVPSGLCFLKVVIRKSYLDSNATMGMIREQLSALDLYMPTIGNDITQFNNHVTRLENALRARGEKTLDLLTYLFKAYNACTDKEFVKYIRDIQTDHEMSSKPISAKMLMSQAEKKYRILVTTKRWQAPTDTEEKLIALQAKLTSLQQKLGNRKRDNNSDKNKNNNNEGGNNSKKPKRDNGKKSGKPSWFKHPPEAGQMHQTKRWNNIDWHYCCSETGGKCGGIWRKHNPKDCTGMAAKKKDGNNHFRKPKPTIELKQAVTDDLEGTYYSDN